MDEGLISRDSVSSDSKYNIKSLSGYEDIENSIGELTARVENSGALIKRISQVFPVYPTPSQSHTKVVSPVSIHVPLCLQGLG